MTLSHHTMVINILLFLMTLLCLAGCDQRDGEPQESQSPEELQEVSVEVITIEPSTFLESGSFYGTVQGQSEATLISHGGGQVNRLKVKAGNRVKKGTRLCSIDGEKFSTAARVAEINEKIARDDYQRGKQHLETGTFSQLQVDRLHQAYLQAQQMAFNARKALRGAYCISPISGTVTHVKIERNQNLPQGSPTMMVADLSKIKIKVSVPENEIRGYQVKGRAVAMVPNDTLTLRGRIDAVSQKVIEHNRSFLVETRFTNTGRLLKPGQTVEVKLYKAPIKDAIVVPSETILSLEKDNAVMVADNGIARRAIVKKGPSNSTHTVIVSGLHSGEKLIVLGHALVSDGNSIRVVE